MDASRHIVSERGAGALTYDEIAHVSGVTRGGITYHFPTKESLLRALVEQDLEQWQSIEEELCPTQCSAETAELLGFLRAHTHEDPERRRFVTGMLSAVMHDPPILDPVRAHENERLKDVEWTDRNLDRELLRMAAMGLFWSDAFGCPQMDKELRRMLVARLEARALEWSNSGDSDDDGKA
ncbi:MAG: TetR/AcrR family transcriptional regulator [Pseudomonadota bacterium]